jgi:hypothetical protein
MDGPDTAVTALFSACNSNSAHTREYGAMAHCMKNIPPESQIQVSPSAWLLVVCYLAKMVMIEPTILLQATAQEVQNLLVSGKRKDALQYAQEGQLWGPALILALQLGDKV